MSKSFEDKIKDHLNDYRVPPPSGAKDKLFGVKPVFDFSAVVPYAGIGLFILSVFMLGRHSVDTDSLVFSEIKTQNSAMIEEPVIEVFEDAWCNSEQLPIEESEILSDYLSTVHRHENPSDLVKLNFSDDQKKMVQSGFYPIALKNIGINYSQAELHFPDQIQKRERKRSEIVPARDQSKRSAYYDMGAYFLYNRLQPNLNDDLFITNYDAPFSLSPSRIGAIVHFGLEQKWSRNHTSRMGVVFNNYNQHFAFQIREFKPDSVIIEDDLYRPVYDQDIISIHKRVNTIGLKFQHFWAMPSVYNSLFVSLEFQQRVGNGASFTYQEKRYLLSQSNQWMVEFGLRKQLADFSKGQLYLIPSIKYTLTNQTSVSALSVRPFSAGLSVSISLK